MNCLNFLYCFDSHKVKVKVKSLSRVGLFATSWAVACTRLLRPWDFLDKSTGVGCHFRLQGIFPTQGSNPGLLHYRQMLYHLSHQGSPDSHKQTLIPKKISIYNIQIYVSQKIKYTV